MISDQELTKKVRGLYNRYPYPLPREDWGLPGHPQFTTKRLNYFLRRRRHHRFSDELKIWVAGCGTTQAVQIALLFPKAHVLGTDISVSALNIAASHAKELKLKNLELKKENILSVRHRDEFDLIFCAGVLHHLRDPLSGLKIVRQSLKKKGAAILMLYNSSHRRVPIVFQQILRTLTLENQNIKARKEISKNLIFDILSRDTCDAPLRGFLATPDLYTDSAKFADTLLHPHEMSFTIDDLFKLLAKAKLRFGHWEEPNRWDLKNFLSDRELLKIGDKLSVRDQYKLVQLLGGEQSPYFVFSVEKREYRKNPEFSHSEIMNFRPLILKHATHIKFQRGRVLSQGPVPLVTVKGDRCVYSNQWGNGGVPITTSVEFPKNLAKVCEVCTGTMTIHEIMERFKSEFSQKELFSFFIQFMKSNSAAMISDL